MLQTIGVQPAISLISPADIAAAIAAPKSFDEQHLWMIYLAILKSITSSIIMKSLQIQGRFMYGGEMLVRMMRMVNLMIEKGNLKMGYAAGIKTLGKCTF